MPTSLLSVPTGFDLDYEIVDPPYPPSGAQLRGDYLPQLGRSPEAPRTLARGYNGSPPVGLSRWFFASDQLALHRSHAARLAFPVCLLTNGVTCSASPFSTSDVCRVLLVVEMTSATMCVAGIMASSVLRGGKHFEILDPVVSWIAIDVMDVFSTL